MAARNEYKDMNMWLLIKGCTDSPKGVKVSKRKDNKGEYLEGIKYDFATVQDMLERDQRFTTDHKLYNTLENMRSLECDDVIREIKKFAQFAHDNDCKSINVYYTGHGESHTGNWCFSDGTMAMKQVLNTIKSTDWEKRNIHLWLDACYSGNWVVDLHRYQNKHWTIQVFAASYPGKVAHDTEKGGLFTTFVSGKATMGFDKVHWCYGWVHAGKVDIVYKQKRLDVV